MSIEGGALLLIASFIGFGVEHYLDILPKSDGWKDSAEDQAYIPNL
jgi:hypothetical protein